MNTRIQRNAAHLPPVSNESRGEAIKQRRLDLGYENPTQFAEAIGKDWQTITRAESGQARASTYDALEAWLSRKEEGWALPVGGEPQAGSPIKLTLHGVYGVEEIIVEGPVDRPDELADAVGKILERLKQRDEGQ